MASGENLSTHSLVGISFSGQPSLRARGQHTGVEEPARCHSDVVELPLHTTHRRGHHHPQVRNERFRAGEVKQQGTRRHGGTPEPSLFSGVLPPGRADRGTASNWGHVGTVAVLLSGCGQYRCAASGIWSAWAWHFYDLMNQESSSVFSASEKS